MITGIDHTGISVAFFCHDGEGNFLFQKRSEHCRDEQGRWDCGGGKLEFGESPQEALDRELKEEYGCEGLVEVVLPPTSYLSQQAGKKKHWIILPHIVLVKRSEVKNNEPRSIDKLDWFRLDNLPEPLHSGVVHDLKIHEPYLEKYK